MKINNDNTIYNQNKGGKDHMICCDREKSFGNIYHSFFMKKSLEKQGIASISSINRNKLRVFTALGGSKTPAWEQKQKP
jgi:hypothetical protein